MTPKPHWMPWHRSIYGDREHKRKNYAIFSDIECSSISSTSVFPIALPRNGGTAFPTWMYCSVFEPSNSKLSGKLCNRAASRTEIARSCSGWRYAPQWMSHFVRIVQACLSQVILPYLFVWSDRLARFIPAGRRSNGMSLQLPPGGM